MKKFIKIILFVGFISLVGFGIYKYTDNNLIVYDNKEQKKHIETKSLFLFFWSSNCISCLYSIPHINFLKQQVEDIGGKFILVLVDENVVLRKMAKAHFIRLNTPNLTTYYDNQGKIQKKYKISGLPTLLIFNKEGKLVRRIEGFIQWAQDPNLIETINLIK